MRAHPSHHSLLVFVALFAGCEGPQGNPPVFPETDDPVIETDDTDAVIDTPPAVDLRPLCQVEATRPPTAPDLVAWGESTRASENRFFGEARSRRLEAMGENNLGETQQQVVYNRVDRGWNRLKLGNIQGSITDLQAAIVLAETAAPEMIPRAREILATAWMRLGEIENCTANGGYACIAPFDPSAQHQLTEGMHNAHEVLLDFLTEDDPDKISPRWLLNVSNMALGSWPDAVPDPWKIGPEYLISEQEVPRWINVATTTGLDANTISGGSNFNDFDGDGYIDIMMSNFDTQLGMRLYLNQGNGQFCEASDASGLSAVPAVLNFSVADFDNDGDLDVFAPRAAWLQTEGIVRASFLENDGTGRFTDITVAAGLDNVRGPSQVSVWGDVDGDGFLDLFVGREQTGDTVAPSSMYINNRNGTFTDMSEMMGVRPPGWVKGATFCDIDNDNDPDLYLSILNGDNRLYENDRELRRFVEIDRGEFKAPWKSFGTFCFDYDQDGYEDLLAAAYSIPPTNNDWIFNPDFGRAAEAYVLDLLGIPNEYEYAHLYHNDGDGFTDVTLSAGLDDVHAVMGMSFGDMDMDGWPDMYFGTGAPDYDALEPNTAYRNDGAGRFLDVTASSSLGHLQKGHGVAFGDFDEDGDEDIVAEMGGAFPGDTFPDALFLNPTNNDTTIVRHGATLRLEGVTSNRNAIGARVRVVTPTRDFLYTVGSTGSFGGNSLQVEVAIADNTEISRIEIIWPSGELETIPLPPLDSVIHIREGFGMISSLPWRRLPITLPDIGGGDEFIP